MVDQRGTATVELHPDRVPGRQTVEAALAPHANGYAAGTPQTPQPLLLLRWVSAVSGAAEMTMDRRDDRVAAIVAPAERRLGLPETLHRITPGPARPRIRPTRLAVGTCSLAPQYAELAVRTPRCRLHGRPQHLRATARFRGKETRRFLARVHRRRRLTGVRVTRDQLDDYSRENRPGDMMNPEPPPWWAAVPAGPKEVARSVRNRGRRV